MAVPRSRIMIACAPCCWGVDDVTNPHLPPWWQVLVQAAAGGFDGLELGPYGYMPLDAAVVGPVLTAHGLSIVAGTIFDDLVSPENLASLLDQTDRICTLITALPPPPHLPGQRYRAPYLTVMDWGHDARDLAAGHTDRARRLADGDWARMMSHIRAISANAARHGVRAVVHPHAGGHIEFADELAALVRDIPADVAGLCLDTGHLAYSGMDPVATLRRYGDRLDYIHFKDIDPAVYRRVMGERVRFFEACAQGVMCPIGHGSIDYAAIHSLLDQMGYGGVITIEQERDPRHGGSVLSDLAASRGFLSRIGFQGECHDQTT